ncbi:ABC-three component system middle component 2 [Rhizobium sp. 18055]|uniref:ABC-three component system middle component 2 n=1 Tax=Rhizobium sp. 18055 TaxID=2681403 RepID=UPI00135A41E4|nr:ABC-three component system middle component 2 [Rhizobium sp. 18055]
MNEPFNSALETGVRTLTILAASFPSMHDLSRLVQYDYLVVHSGDADPNGPSSLHPPLPMRSGELLVRRGLVERGLHLLLGRGLARRVFNERGVFYQAEEEAGAFLSNLRERYNLELQERADWVAQKFDELDDFELDEVIKSVFSAGTAQFLPVENLAIEDDPR